MKRIKTYQLFESSVRKITDTQSRFLNSAVFGTWYQDEETGEVEVDGSFNITSERMPDLLGIRFSRAGLNFFASGNLLTNLNGFPRSVWRDFSVARNQLRSLAGGPEEVGGNYDCADNQLETLKGAPDMVGGDFLCENNKLSSLEGGPSQVEGMFECSFNQLGDLKGAPVHVGAGFVAIDCGLTSLEGFPRSITGGFDLSGNPVSEDTFYEIANTMTERAKTYQEALEIHWDEIPMGDKILLFRPEFKFIEDSQYRLLSAKSRVAKIQDQL